MIIVFEIQQYFNKELVWDIIMRCLVTGATGFVGSNIALTLDLLRHDVVGVGCSGEQVLDDFSGEIIKKSFYDLDWDAIGKVDVLFHQAAMVGMLRRDGSVFSVRDEFIDINTTKTIELFRKAISKGCKRIVYASTTAVYGDSKEIFVEGKNENPNSPYGESRVILEGKVKELNEEFPDVVFVGLRYCNVYGPRENHKGKSANVVYQFAQQMLIGNPKLFKFGEQVRDEIYIKDVVRANLLASEAKESCVVNCGSGAKTSFNRMIEVLNQTMMGLNREIEYIDNPFPFFQEFTHCDMTKAKEMIGFESEYSIEKGIQDYYDSGWLVRGPIDSVENKVA